VPDGVDHFGKGLIDGDLLSPIVDRVEADRHAAWAPTLWNRFPIKLTA